MQEQDYQSVFKTTAVYKAQCKTSAIAREITNNHYDAAPMESFFKPPFCLRILKPYRTQEMQDFRDKVAAQIKATRIRT